MAKLIKYKYYIEFRLSHRQLCFVFALLCYWSWTARNANSENLYRYIFAFVGNFCKTCLSSCTNIYTRIINSCRNVSGNPKAPHERQTGNGAMESNIHTHWNFREHLLDHFTVYLFSFQLISFRCTRLIIHRLIVQSSTVLVRCNPLLVYLY